MSRKLYLCLLITFSIVSHLQGSGWVEKKGDKTIIHVTVERLPDPNDIRANNRAKLAIVRNFERDFPQIFKTRYAEKYRNNPQKYGNYNWDNVEVALKPFSGIRIERWDTHLMAIAGGTAPDILYINFKRSSNYINNGLLYPLSLPEDNYFAALSQEEVDFRVHPKIRPVIERLGPNGSKHVWAIPFDGALVRVLLYNKMLFDEKSVDYPTKDWTWDDLLAASRQLTDPDRGIYATTFLLGKDQSWELMSFLWSAGGEVMTYDESTNQWKLQFASHAGAVALDYYVQLTTEKWTDKNGVTQRGYVLRTGDNYGSNWDLDKIAIFFGSLDEKLISTLDPAKYGMAPVPLGPTGMRASELNSQMYGLFANIKHPAVRDAAWEYLDYITSKSAMELKTKIMVESGYGQFINPKYLEMFGYPEIVRQSPKGWVETFEIALQASKPEVYGTNSNYAYEMMSAPMETAIQLSFDDKLPQAREERLNIFADLLQDAQDRAEEVMLGQVPPAERKLRDMTATLVLVFIGLGSLFAFRSIYNSFTPPHEIDKNGKAITTSWGFKRYIWAYILILPAALTIFVWKYLPLGQGLIMAFQEYSLLGESAWVGIQNFGDVLFDKLWWLSVWNSARFSFLAISLSFIPPMILAILLQEVPKGKVFFRVMFYLPAVLTGLVTMVMWKQFYSERGGLNIIINHTPAYVFVLVGVIVLWCCCKFASRLKFHLFYGTSAIVYGVGILLFATITSFAWPVLFPAHSPDATIWQTLLDNLPTISARLSDTHTEPIRWLTDPNHAMLAIVLPIVWAQLGPGCLIYLAALKSIPNDLYDAANIDGATFIDKILFIVLPYLKVIIIINFIGAFVGSIYGAADNVMAMTGGGANTEVSDLHIFYKAFVFLKFGHATAMAWILGFMLIGFTVYQLKILSRADFKTAGSN